MPKLLRYCVFTSVSLRIKLPVEEADGRPAGTISGYYQNFGVTAESPRAAEELVEGSIADGFVRWEEVETRQLVDTSH